MGGDPKKLPKKFGSYDNSVYFCSVLKDKSYDNISNKYIMEFFAVVLYVKKLSPLGWLN